MSKGQGRNWHGTFASWVPDLAQVFSPALVFKQGCMLKSLEYWNMWLTLTPMMSDLVGGVSPVLRLSFHWLPNDSVILRHSKNLGTTTSSFSDDSVNNIRTAFKLHNRDQ